MLQDQTATNEPPSPQVTWAPQQQETFMLDRLSHLQILQLNVGRNWVAHETTLQPAFENNCHAVLIQGPWIFRLFCMIVQLESRQYERTHPEPHRCR